jgi:hypothetical protein
MDALEIDVPIASIQCQLSGPAHRFFLREQLVVGHFIEA